MGAGTGQGSHTDNFGDIYPGGQFPLKPGIKGVSVGNTGDNSGVFVGDGISGTGSYNATFGSTDIHFPEGVNESVVLVSDEFEPTKSNTLYVGNYEMYPSFLSGGAVRNLYSKRNGEINMDLLNKVRTLNNDGEYVVSTKNLSLEDLPNKMDTNLTPEFISGPTLVPVADSGSFPVRVTERLWDAMGEANARFSRESIVLNEMVRVRKEIAESGLEKRIMDLHTKGLQGDNLKAATVVAKKEIVALTEELS